MYGPRGAWNPKAEAVRLWNADPCGGPVDVDAEASPEFFAAVDRSRYGEYAPWMPAVMGFSGVEGLRVLEVGCGLGTDLAQFARGGGTVFGLDLVPRHLRIAKARMVHEGIPVRLVQGDAEQLPLVENSVDLVYSFGVLHHTPDIASAIQEIRRVLRPGGRFVLGLYHRDSLFYWGSTVLFRGVLRGGLWRFGYQKLVADIERHDHSDALPLVRVYSRRQVRRLLKDFLSVSIETQSVNVNPAFLPCGIRRVLRWTVARYGEKFGWYVIAKARK